MESLNFDLEIPTYPLQNYESILNTGNDQAPARTFVALTRLFGVPLLEFRIYVSDAPPPYFSIFVETTATITKALFDRVATGAVVIGLVQIR